MQELEKILEEIDNHAVEFELFGTSDDYISVGWAKEIIRKHMNDGWIPVEERLPEDPEENPVFDDKQLELYLVCVDGGSYPLKLLHIPGMSLPQNALWIYWERIP